MADFDIEQHPDATEGYYGSVNPKEYVFYKEQSSTKVNEKINEILKSNNKNEKLAELFGLKSISNIEYDENKTDGWWFSTDESGSLFHFTKNPTFEKDFASVVKFNLKGGAAACLDTKTTIFPYHSMEATSSREIKGSKTIDGEIKNTVVHLAYDSNATIAFTIEGSFSPDSEWDIVNNLSVSGKISGFVMYPTPAGTGEKESFTISFYATPTKTSSGLYTWTSYTSYVTNYTVNTNASESDIELSKVSSSASLSYNATQITGAAYSLGVHEVNFGMPIADLYLDKKQTIPNFLSKAFSLSQTQIDISGSNNQPVYATNYINQNSALITLNMYGAGGKHISYLGTRAGKDLKWNEEGYCFKDTQKYKVAQGSSVKNWASGYIEREIVFENFSKPAKTSWSVDIKENDNNTKILTISTLDSSNKKEYVVGDKGVVKLYKRVAGIPHKQFFDSGFPNCVTEGGRKEEDYNSPFYGYIYPNIGASHWWDFMPRFDFEFAYSFLSDKIDSYDKMKYLDYYCECSTSEIYETTLSDGKTYVDPSTEIPMSRKATCVKNHQNTKLSLGVLMNNYQYIPYIDGYNDINIDKNKYWELNGSGLITKDDNRMSISGGTDPTILSNDGGRDYYDTSIITSYRPRIRRCFFYKV